jgi:hypothetical protein
MRIGYACAAPKDLLVTFSESFNFVRMTRVIRVEDLLFMSYIIDSFAVADKEEFHDFSPRPEGRNKSERKKKLVKSGTGGERGNKLLPWTLKEVAWQG